MKEKKNSSLKKAGLDEFMEMEKSFLADLDSVNLDRNWKAFRAKLERRSAGESLTAKRERNRYVFYSLAAAITVLLVFAFLLANYSGKSKVQVHRVYATNKNSELRLEDGSLIVLREGSEISFPERFRRNLREVNLSGEAFFDVQKDRSAFVVQTQNTSIKVVGTSFNVNESHEGDVIVSVLSGKVQFSPNPGEAEALALGPGEQGVYRHSDSSLQVEKITTENFLFWKTDSLSFDNETLKKVFATLEEYYNVVILVMDKEILNIRLTTIIKDQDINDIMDEISLLFDLSYTTRQDTIITDFKPR